MRALAVLVLFAGSFLAAGCGEPEPRNLLILVSDAFRADALSCDGGADGSGPRTPNLCGLAERGVRFERAFANAPWTLPSTLSMFTGRPPGWYRMASSASEAPKGMRFYRVPEEELLLGELLRDLGYRMGSSVENPVARRGHALQGFEHRGFNEKRREEVLRGLDPRIGFLARDSRYLKTLWLLDLLSSPSPAPFAALHWIDDPHAPYRPPADLLPDAAPSDLPHPVEYYAGLGHNARPERERRKLRNVAEDLTPAEIAFLRDLYHLEVRSVDERIGYILRALELSGLEDRTLVVFTSDHGEGFGEHGDFLHGVSLYDELVRVPLIFAGPGIEAGHRVAAPVSHVDLVPTLADLLGLEGLEPWAGRSLRRHLEGRPGGKERFHYLSSPDRLDRDGVVWGPYKLLAGFAEGASEIELYDSEADREERHNLVDELPEVRTRMLRALLRFREEEERRWQAREHSGEASITAEDRVETERALRAVGYLD